MESYEYRFFTTKNKIESLLYNLLEIKIVSSRSFLRENYKIFPFVCNVQLNKFLSKEKDEIAFPSSEKILHWCANLKQLS